MQVLAQIVVSNERKEADKDSFNEVIQTRILKNELPLTSLLNRKKNTLRRHML